MSERMEGRRGGFTLIELMVVIMIVGVLFAVALPMFENAGKKDTRQAAQQLVNTLRLARQHAISARQWTLVVFPNQDSSYDRSGNAKAINNLADKCLRSYAVLAVTNSMDGQFCWGENGRGTGSWKDPPANAMQFEFLMEWRKLPEGIYFDDEVSGKGTQEYLFGHSGGYQGTFNFPWDPADTNKREGPMSAILFKPNGRVFYMAEGNKKKGSFWVDQPQKIYLTSAKFYNNISSDSMGDSVEISGGTNTVIQLLGKTGQIMIGN